MCVPETLDHAVVLIHRIVGYPLAFIVAPLALARFAGAPGHRSAGLWYVVLMTFLYISGTSLTLTRHDWGTWEFGRNVVFNLLGYSLLLYGFRAMWLLNKPEVVRPARLDRVLLAVLVASVAVLVVLAAMRSGPLQGIALAGILLLGLEIRDWRRGFAATDLYRRHVRYMIASYCYVLTVVSLVHLRDELSSDARWLWPSVLGAIVIWLSCAEKPALLRRNRARLTRYAMRSALVVALGFGLYVSWELLRGVPIGVQQEPRMTGDSR